jgi:hypothetical protein
VDIRSETPERAAASTAAARRVAVGGALAIALLAIVETGNALVAPSRAPKDADWAAAEQAVRAGWRPGDLIVAAPAWADPILRVHLGDVIPAAVAGRLDDERFARVWEVSQRGARAPEAGRGAVALERRFGALTVRLVERPAARVSYDFVDRWTDARVTREQLGRPPIPCPRGGDRFQCPDVTFNYVRRQIVEVDTRLRQALLAQPVGGAAVVIEYPAVPLGRELVIATGLHDVWMRKAARGQVDLRVIVGGQPAASVTTANESGWLVTHVDTTARAGQLLPVRFEIRSAAPYARHFALAAEARG